MASSFLPCSMSNERGYCVIASLSRMTSRLSPAGAFQAHIHVEQTRGDEVFGTQKALLFNYPAALIFFGP